MLKALFTKAPTKRADHVSAEAETEENRRAVQRFDVKRYNGIISSDGLSYQLRLRNLSCTGVSGLTAAAIENNQPVSVELMKGVLWPAIVRWTRGTSIGLSFGRPLPMYLVTAILEADQRHCRPSKAGETDLGPLTGAELSVLDWPPEESIDRREDPQMAGGATTGQDRNADKIDEFEDGDRSADERAEDVLASSRAEPERRVEPRIQVMHLIARITSGNLRGLCCLRSISDSGLMAETSLALRPGDEVELEISNRHRLCGRVVWRDEAGAGVVLNESIDSVLLLSQLAEGDAELVQASALEV